MTKNYFMPRTDAEKALWLKNFATKLPSYIAKYGLAAGDVSDAQKGADFFAWVLDARNLINESTNKWTTFRDEIRDGIPPGALPSAVPVAATLPTMPTLVAPGVIGRVSSIANRIKKHISYTEADGRDLGLEGIEQTIDLIEAKPIISIRINGGHPEIVWTKNKMSAIEIHVDRSNSGNYVFLAVDSYPNYIDTAPLPNPGESAQWKYKAIYRYKDTIVGHWSDEVSIPVSASM